MDANLLTGFYMRATLVLNELIIFRMLNFVDFPDIWKRGMKSGDLLFWRLVDKLVEIFNVALFYWFFIWILLRF